MSKSLLSCMKDFNTSFEVFQRQKSEGTKNLLNRNLLVLSGTVHIDVFNPNTVDKCQFFINLHDATSSLEPTEDTLWLTVSVLQQACRNLTARQAIVSNFRFIPLLAKVLSKVTASDKVKRLLSLLQDLTYGIQITWEEPYLSDFVQVLVDFINGEDETLGFTALSVLVNICYKNSVCTYLLLRTVRTSAFAAKIKCYGILANKMLIILGCNGESWKISDLQNFVKMSFQEIESCLRNWNVPYLRHIVEFITDANDYEALHVVLNEYKNLSADMEELVKSIESRFQMDDMQQGDENVKNQQMCIGLIFEMFDYILQLNSQDKSFSPTIHRIFNLATNWLLVENAGAKALNLIKTIVGNIDDEGMSKINEPMNDFLPHLIESCEKQGTPNQQVTSVLRLLVTLLKNCRAEGLLLSTLTDTFFDKMFSPLTSASAESLNYNNLSEHDLAKYLFCLLILIECSNGSKSVSHGKLLKLLRLKQVQFVIAKGHLCQNEELCRVVFEIAQTAEFPRNEVSKIMTQLRSVLAIKQSQPVPEGVKSTLAPFKESKMYISKTLEERLDNVITHILEANRNGQLHNVATSELIEMFSYKINLFNNAEKNLNKRLEDAASEITNLSHRLSLQSNEMTKLHSMNFKSHLTEESLQAQLSDLSKQLENLRRTACDLTKKSEVQRDKYQAQSKNLSVKIAKVEELRSELEKYKVLEANTAAELKQLQTTTKEYAVRIDHYKSSIARFEEKLNQQEKALSAKEKEILKATRSIEELNESNLKSENLIRHLESQVAEMKETISTYEADINETEELRKTILSLMESKKPKRKA